MNETANFDEFLNAFDGTDDYQTASETETEETTEQAQETEAETAEEGAETAQEAATSDESGENSEDAAGEGGEKKPQEAEQMAESFTIKVNKEERTVTRDELIAMAQKGSDYDRVKGQAEQAKNDNQALTEQLAQMQPVYDVLSQIAADSGVEVLSLLDTFRVRLLMEKNDLTEKEATERLGRLKAEEQLKTLQKPAPEKTADQTRQERMEREVKEFKQVFPDVELASLPVQEMAADIAAGMSMTQAYLKYQNGQQQAEIQKLNQQLKAQEQNQRNKSSSPGSASDSGSRKTKDQFDDFFAAFG